MVVIKAPRFEIIPRPQPIESERVRTIAQHIFQIAYQYKCESLPYVSGGLPEIREAHFFMRNPSLPYLEEKEQRTSALEVGIWLPLRRLAPHLGEQALKNREAPQPLWYARMELRDTIGNDEITLRSDDLLTAVAYTDTPAKKVHGFLSPKGVEQFEQTLTAIIAELEEHPPTPVTPPKLWESRVS